MPGIMRFVSAMAMGMTLTLTLERLAGGSAGTLLQVLELLTAMRPAGMGGQPSKATTSPSTDGGGSASSAKVYITLGLTDMRRNGRGEHPPPPPPVVFVGPKKAAEPFSRQH